METPDGYPYPKIGAPDNNWKWIKEAHWTDSKPANDYMANIGDRAQDGIKGFIQGLGKSTFSWLTSALTFLIDVVPLPIPGKGQLAIALDTAIRTGAIGEVDKILTNLHNELTESVGLDAMTQKLKIPLYVPKSMYDDLVGQFIGMPNGFDRSLCVHWHIERWGWQRDVLKTFDFNKDANAQATYVTVISALINFCNFEWLSKWQKAPRLFFAGDGAAITLTHLSGTSPRSMRWDNKADIKDMRLISKNISMLNITHDEAEAKAFQDDLAGLAEKANERIQGAELSSTAKLTLLGLAASFVFKK